MSHLHLEYGKSHMTNPHPSCSHLSITGPGPPLPPASAGSLETAITATTTVSQLSQSASPTPVTLPSRTPQPHQPVSLMPTATWLTSAVPVPAAEQTTHSPPMKPKIVTKHPKNGAGSSEQFPEVSLAQPSSAMLDGAPTTSMALLTNQERPSRREQLGHDELEAGDACEYADVACHNAQHLASITT